MKAIDVLRCIMYMGVSGEELNLIDVPTTDDEWTPQNEEWWFSMIGGCPKPLVESGTYLCFYPNDARDFLQSRHNDFVPDATIHVDDNIVYLYKLED